MCICMSVCVWQEGVCAWLKAPLEARGRGSAGVRLTGGYEPLMGASKSRKNLSLPSSPRIFLVYF